MAIEPATLVAGGAVVTLLAATAAVAVVSELLAVYVILALGFYFLPA